MSKLVYYFGAMGCSKTANALMTRFRYETNNRKVWLIKPGIDTRDDTDKTIIRSRIGLQAEAQAIGVEENIVELYKKHKSNFHDIDVIICDECQFLTAEQVVQLKQLAETKDIIVYCYGLRTDFRTDLFSGSAKLFCLADEIIQLEAVCDCGRPAIVNARFTDGKVVTTGNQIDIGGDEKYKPLCWSCWMNAQLKE